MEKAMEQDSMASKIQKLLAKAERAGSEEEAAAFFTKAQELMTKHGISEAMLDSKNPERRGLPERMRFALGRQGAGIKARRNLLTAIGHINDCEVAISGDRAVLTVFGFHADVENTAMMFSSVDLQMATAMRREQVGHPERRSATWKTNFMYGYADRIASRLRAQKRETMAEAEAAEPGTALVLVSRHNEVVAAIRAVTTGRSSIPTRHQHDAGARASGMAAADRADLGRGTGALR
jgi:hypothetical protein